MRQAFTLCGRCRRWPCSCFRRRWLADLAVDLVVGSAAGYLLLAWIAGWRP